MFDSLQSFNNSQVKAHSMFSVSNLQPEGPPSIAFFLIFIQLTHTFTKFVFQTNFLW